jgi:HAD superfamily hydrolase (TIGR01490 family)
MLAHDALPQPGGTGQAHQRAPAPTPSQGLALFDLDHTLIAFDSGGAFTRWLSECGRLDAGFEPRYLSYCHDYAAGRLDMRAMHHFTVGTLAALGEVQLQAWLIEFEHVMAARITPAARALVQAHQQQGDLCALVTATTRFIAEPFARLFGIEHVLATEPARDAQGRLNGEIVGEPCFRQHKCAHVERWLASRGQRLADFELSSFYSDSMHDLPLLQAVRRPVAVDANSALAAHAQALGWANLSLHP